MTAGTPAPLGQRPGAGAAVRAVALFLLAQGASLGLLWLLDPRFFWLDDQQAQYLPAFSWLGRTAVDGRPALLDPDAGGGGNYLADPQYGVLDPAHWLIDHLVGSTDSLLLAAWLLGAGATVLLGAGVVLLLLRSGVRTAVAVAAATGVASTGFFLWIGSSWWPSMWGVAWLPWLWLGLRGRGWLTVLVTGLAAWQLVASGYPYVLPVAAVLVLAHVATERWGGRLRDRALGARVLAGAAGGVLGAPGLLGAQEMVVASTRSAPPASAVGNSGGMIPNLLDALVGGATTTPSVSGEAGGFLFVVPIAATAVFVLGGLALVQWRAAVRHPPVVVALAVLVAAAVLTQLPSDVGPLRYPFRYLAVVSLAGTVLVATAVSLAPRATRRRVQVALGLVGLQFLLAVSRGPALIGWHLVALAAGTVAMGALALAVRDRPLPVARAARVVRSPVVVGAVLVLVSVAAGTVGVLSATTTGGRLPDAAAQVTSGSPARQLQTRPAWGTTVEQFRDRSLLTDTSVTVLVYGSFSADETDPDDGWSEGVLVGNANLLADLRPGFGYTAVGHRGWVGRWCQDLFGLAGSSDPRCVRNLLADAPGLGTPWIDVLSSDVMAVPGDAPQEIRDHLAATRTEEGRAGGFTLYRRTDGLPGRVTWAAPGTTVRAVPGAPTASAYYSGRPGDSVEVSTGPDGGAVVLRVPAWPGLRAQVDGRDVPVGSVQGTVLSVDLPADLDGARLDIEFAPPADRLLPVSWGVGGALLAVAVLVQVVPRRRRRDTGGGSAQE